MKIAIYPGSFDPITTGHLNIIERASKIFDRLIVCTMVNAGKRSPMFTHEERVEFIRRVTSHLPNVEVDSSCELLADYARSKGDCVIVKGLRAGTTKVYIKLTYVYTGGTFTDETSVTVTDPAETVE